jgi:hypothetical protein
MQFIERNSTAEQSEEHVLVQPLRAHRVLAAKAMPARVGSKWRRTDVAQCPLCPRKQTLFGVIGMSA